MKRARTFTALAFGLISAWASAQRADETHGLALTGSAGAPRFQDQGRASAEDRARLLPPPLQFGPWREVERTETWVEYTYSFPSAFTSKYAVNNTVPLRLILPVVRSGPIPVVLITHYWGARDLRAERALATDLNAAGVGAAILTLPFHLSRAPAGTKSGEMAILPDPVALDETMTQAVLDVRRAVDFLQTRPEFLRTPMGIAGTSLGALVAALSFGIEPRLTHASFVLGGAQFARILWSSSRVIEQRDVLRRKGYTEERLEQELKRVEPLSYLPREVPGRSMAVVARYDTVIPAESSSSLLRSLKDPAVLRLDTGHYGGIFVQRRVLREVAKFFSTEFEGREYVAPSRLIAPTLRLGMLVNPPTGFDLGGGIDVWSSDPSRRNFATAFLTPRGFALFGGQNVGGGFALGVVIGPRRAGLGLLWSAVL